VGAVLIPGAKAPYLITHKDLTLMNPGSVIIDVAIDQGGCVETSRPTTHSAIPPSSKKMSCTTA
jgi:alanine dehydrogenase